MRVPKEENPKELVAFRALLVNRCQIEFEKDRDDENDFAQKQKEIDEAETVSLSLVCILLHLQI